MSTMPDLTGYQKEVDDAGGGVVYTGWARPGFATTTKRWIIQKVTTTGSDVQTLWPVRSNGSPGPSEEFGWDERASLNYSATDDTTAPTLSTVEIASDGLDPLYAKVGDTITVTFISNEYIKDIVATIAGHAATVTEGVDDKHFTATYDMVTGDTEGLVPFTIDFEDIVGHPGVQVTAVTDASQVTFDKTKPTAALTYSKTGAAPYVSSISAKNADTLTIRAVFTEALLDSPIVKLTIDNGVLAATNMVKDSATEYHYDLNVPAGDIAIATCTLTVGTDVASNVVTAAPTWGATFKIDNTAPDMTIGTVVSNNADTTRAKSGDIVTLTFTTSETLASNPTVMLWGQAMTFGTLVGSTYTYTRTLTGAETGGATTDILVTSTDPAGNVTTDENIGSFITDFTAPTLSSATRTNDTTLDVALSELALLAGIDKDSAGGFVVYETGAPGTLYAVSAINPGGDNSHVVLTVADMSASALAGVTVTYVAGGLGTVADRAGNILATDATGVPVTAW